MSYLFAAVTLKYTEDSSLTILRHSLVIFSQACVENSVDRVGEGVCLNACWDIPPRSRPPPPREADCSIRSTSGRYASYWNVFLLQVELEVTLPGEGKDRVFKVAMKWVAQISLYALEEALEGRSRNIPFEAIQALDVVMRHLPSMT